MTIMIIIEHSDHFLNIISNNDHSAVRQRRLHYFVSSSHSPSTYHSEARAGIVRESLFMLGTFSTFITHAICVLPYTPNFDGFPFGHNAFSGCISLGASDNQEGAGEVVVVVV